MGNFYVNFTAKTEDHAKVVEILLRATRSAFVTPVLSGYIVVTEQVSDEQNPLAIEQVGRLMSRELAVPVLAFLNHDDSMLCYWLFNNGALVDEYNSDPGYFTGQDVKPSGGDAQKLCSFFCTEKAVSRIKTILEDGDTYVFAHERHRALVEALNLPIAGVGFGYGYAASGEEREGLDLKDLTKVP